MISPIIHYLFMIVSSFQNVVPISWSFWWKQSSLEFQYCYYSNSYWVSGLQHIFKSGLHRPITTPEIIRLSFNIYLSVYWLVFKRTSTILKWITQLYRRKKCALLQKFNLSLKYVEITEETILMKSAFPV